MRANVISSTCEPGPDDGIVVVMRTDDYLSAEEVLRHRELVWGVVREPPSPFVPHQRVTTRTAALLDHHVRHNDLGTVLVAPMDVVLDRDHDLVLQPDVMFISHARSGIIREFVWGAPDLVVEVSSAGTARYDRTDKVTWYRTYGVRECWLVDSHQQIVTVIDLTVNGVGVRFQPSDPVQSRVLPLLSVTAADLLDGRPVP
jgi:Uma2 family endonuclease